MSDGRIIFSTKIDNKDLDKGLKEAESKIKKASAEIEKNESAKLPLTKKSDELSVALDKAVYKLRELKKEKADFEAATRGVDPAVATEAYGNKRDFDSEIKEQEKAVSGLDKQFNSVNDKIDSYNAKISAAKETLQENEKIAGEYSKKLNSAGKHISDAMEKANASTERLKKRVISLGKRVLIFSVVARAFREIKDYTAKALKTNKEYTAQLAKLKGALLTAFQPLYQIILPVAQSLLKVFTAVATVVAHVLSVLTGKTAKQSADAAKNLDKEANGIDKVGKAAKKATKSLAGFDEITKLNDQNAVGSEPAGGTEAPSGPDFSDFDTGKYKEKIDELTLILSGSLLALGAILAFSGANIPRGIALMALGAAGMAAEIKENWNLIVEKLQGPIGAIVSIVSTAFLAIGAILAFSGAQIPLGIALMAIGAAGLATTVAVNWETIKEKLQGPIGGITAIVSGALLVLGIILCCTGVALPLGIALIAAGAAGLVTVVAVNWNFITDKCKEIWDNVKNWFNTHVKPIFTIDWWKNLFSSIWDGLKAGAKAGLNACIKILNKAIGWINDKVHISWGSLELFGKELIPAGEFQLFTIPNIPYLAKGGVIPPNAPFAAVLGDQRHGTNIEAPLETIQEAVANVMGDMSSGMMAGFEASVAVQRDILEAVLGIQIGDETIANAVNNYNRRMAVVNGGGAL